jgi:hypothetical protein
VVAWDAKGFAGPSVSRSVATTILPKEESTGVGQVRFCCGNSMLPRMVEIKSQWGDGYFLTIWRCRVCRRIWT